MANRATSTAEAASPYTFERGFPTPETIQRAYDEADLNRAVQAYRYFYPTVSMAAIWKGNESVGVFGNKGALLMEGSPHQLVFTPNSDTPYAGLPLDLSGGPLVVELPPGPLMCVINDLNQRYVADLGLPGPDGGTGGKHLILPPDYKGDVPAGYYASTSSTNRILLMLRVIPVNGDINAAFEMMKTIKVTPLNASAGWRQPEWQELGNRQMIGAPMQFEANFKYWDELYEVINTEPPRDADRNYYGELAVLGIVKGQPFNPDARMKNILEQAARMGSAQMRVQSFADRRPDREVWPDRKWEWATLRSENGTFDAPTYVDLDAREKWFYQAQIESPAMFRRTAGAGSLYWLGLKDNTGAYLDGGKSYRLTVPQPVPAKLFWSVTVYDSDTRSEIQSDLNHAALRSMYELKDQTGTKPVDLYFGPEAPSGMRARWIKTLPGKGWFAYFRIYGPDQAAFDGSWKPGDFERIK